MRYVDAKRFVELWLEGKTSTEIARELDMSTAHVFVYAARLRDQGVELPRRKKARKIDVVALNAIIEKSKEPVKPIEPTPVRFTWSHDSPNCDNNCDCYERAAERAAKYGSTE